MRSPGYGFLSERRFRQKVEKAGLIWIGPPASAIERGSKTEARALMITANVPVVPGTKGAVNSADRKPSSLLKRRIHGIIESRRRQWWLVGVCASCARRKTGRRTQRRSA
ncbi:MAG: hypothetical protein IPP40_15550 [bacterium]|nr:hypothetical protein [bacterium]